MPRPDAKASVAYGDEFLTDIFDQRPHPGAWNLEGSLYQKCRNLLQNVHFFLTPAANQEGREVITRRWSDRKDPFTQADLLDSEEDEVKELILRIRTSLPIFYTERLANRLVTLFNDAKAEDSASLGIAVGSLRSFYNFLHLHTNLKLPTISLTPEYNIYASWRVEQNRLFSVHFLPDGNVRFVIFKPNDRHPERQIRISGTATTDILMETVGSHGVWAWVLE